ncbi:hypothetical protein [Paenibacillus sp. 1781tsa1]|uniref:hypothetical protein n=1 Tax=Paenibacillus sp. 1781tsa1 TaxID=2953810 RepID=UPI0020A03428|nr:hypothetical protein [Paenibacillus sp. 1781tsa1]MCP1182297.1 hypothetical protein [Paenibacillus sp. 1781tsa1]
MNQDHEPFLPGASEASGEHATKAVYLTQGEMQAIQKAILLLKFESEETASLLYAGSPLLNSVLEKVRDVSSFGEYAKELHSRPNEHAEQFIRAKLERSYAEESALVNERWRRRTKFLDPACIRILLNEKIPHTLFQSTEDFYFVIETYHLLD